MTALLTILGVFNVLLGVLKAIPATSAIANEVAAIEQAIQNAITSGQGAAVASGEKVDPSLLLPIAPVGAAPAAASTVA